jgi:hypothetical protein
MITSELWYEVSELCETEKADLSNLQWGGSRFEISTEAASVLVIS